MRYFYTACRPAGQIDVVLLQLYQPEIPCSCHGLSPVSDLKQIENIGKEIEQVLVRVPGTRSAFAERLNEGYYVDVIVNRREAARYGLRVGDVQAVIASGVGGETITTTVEGRERYSVNVRYKRELRDDPQSLKRILIPTSSGAQIPLQQVADVVVTKGPPSIADEGGSLSGLVSVAVAGRDIRGYVEEAQRAVREHVALPAGYTLQWSGQYEHLIRAEERLKMVVPVTLGVILLLLYLNFRSMAKSLIVLLSVPFAVIGAIWFLYLLGYNLSVAVWVGIIALAGVAAETGVVMLVYLDEPMSGGCVKAGWPRPKTFVRRSSKARCSACGRR